jgi:hypothetical protein
VGRTVPKTMELMLPAPSSEMPLRCVIDQAKEMKPAAEVRRPAVRRERTTGWLSERVVGAMVEVVRQFLEMREWGRAIYICHGDQHTMRSARVGGAALTNLGAEIIDRCVDHRAVQLRNSWRALAVSWARVGG